jgi:4-amino-4-deoxy-L-arabinose transferase-like glycosyltransferase
VEWPRSLTRAHLAALGVGALAVRLAYIGAFLRDYTPVSDADHYHTLALAVSRGEGLVHVFPFDFVHPTAFRPPLYPLLLGGVYAVTGRHLLAAQLLNALLGSVAVVLVAVLAMRLAGPRAGLVAGVVAALYPPLLANDGVPLSEPLALCLLLATALLLLREQVLWAGVTCGLLVLTRSSAQLLAVVLVAWLLWRAGWRRAVVFAGVLALVVAPWPIRNWLQLDSPVFVTSNGFNLGSAYSSAARAEGDWVDPFFDPRLAGLREGITDEVELDDAVRRNALRSLRDHPGQVAPVVARNAGKLLDVTPEENDSPEYKDGRNLSLRWLTLPWVWLTTLVGLIGLWQLRRQRSVEALALMVGYFTLACLFTVAVPRLRAPLDIACCIGVGVVMATRSKRAPDLGQPAMEELTLRSP